MILKPVIVSQIWDSVDKLKAINKEFPLDPKNPLILDKVPNTLLSGMVIPKDAFNEDGSPDFEDNVWWPLFY